ncbi:MAG: cohesin domain-containing protein [Candidatus Syntropharchaeales archaeon]
MNSIVKRISLFIPVVLLIIPTIVTAADAANVNVTINAPEYVSEDTFEVTIDVTEITDLNGGQFDLVYDPEVIEVVEVKDGNIDGTKIPIVGKRHFTDDDYDRYRVLFKLDGADCVSGSGYLAKIIFEVVGGIGDTTIIDIVDDFDEEGEPPNLAEADAADEIPANWFGTTVNIGTAPSTPAERLTPTSMPTIAETLAPTPTTTSIETPSLESASESSVLRARTQSASVAAVPDASLEENGGLQNIFTAHNFLSIYSFVGLLAFIYALRLLRW